MATRYDRASLGDTKRPYKTDDGLLLCEASLCRAGVLEYKQPNGTVIKEFRPPEENERAIAEMGLLPVGIEHPTSLVTADSAQTYRRGVSLQNVRLGKGGYVTADIAVWDPELQRIIESGEKREVSLGYKCDVKEEPGVWMDSDGVEHRYDRVQRNIQPNHIAVTKKARAGDTVKLHMDSADEDFAVMVMLDDEDFKTEDAAPRTDGCGCDGGDCNCPNCKGKGKGKKGVPRMEGKKVKMSFDMGGGMSQEYEVPEEMADSMKAKMDKYRKDAEDLVEELERKDAEIEELQDAIAELQEALESNTEVYDELRETYDSLAVDLEEIAEEIEDLDLEPEEIDVDALVEQVISDRLDAYEAVSHLLPGKDFDYRLDADEWAIAALEANGVELDEDERMDSNAIAVALKVLDQQGQRQDSTMALQARLEQVRRDSYQDGDRFDSASARQRMIARSAELRNKKISELV